VVIFTDSESAYKLSKLNDEIIHIMDPEVSEKLEAEAQVLADKILASKLTFHMQGIDQKSIEAIESDIKAEKDSDEWWNIYMASLIASNIKSVENASGQVDEHKFTLEEVLELRGSLSGESWNLLMSTMQKLTLATGYFKGLTDAGFLQKS
jgi:hypothetical protein